MPNFERVVMRMTAWAVGLDLLAIERMTAAHFDPEKFYEKYDRASVEAMSERGGW